MTMCTAPILANHERKANSYKQTRLAITNATTGDTIFSELDFGVTVVAVVVGVVGVAVVVEGGDGVVVVVAGEPPEVGGVAVGDDPAFTLTASFMPLLQWPAAPQMK